MKKKDVTTKGLFLNILWSLKRIYCYSKRYFICLCIDSILSGMTPIILLLIIQKVIDCIQYRTGDYKDVEIQISEFYLSFHLRFNKSDEEDIETLKNETNDV